MVTSVPFSELVVLVWLPVYPSLSLLCWYGYQCTLLCWSHGAAVGLEPCEQSAVSVSSQCSSCPLRGLPVLWCRKTHTLTLQIDTNHLLTHAHTHTHTHTIIHTHTMPFIMIWYICSKKKNENLYHCMHAYKTTLSGLMRE